MVLVIALVIGTSVVLPIPKPVLELGVPALKRNQVSTFPADHHDEPKSSHISAFIVRFRRPVEFISYGWWVQQRWSANENESTVWRYKIRKIAGAVFILKGLWKWIVKSWSNRVAQFSRCSSSIYLAKFNKRVFSVSLLHLQIKSQEVAVSKSYKSRP